MGEAASLLRDRNFIKGPGHCPRVISILRLGFRLVRAFTACHVALELRSLRSPAITRFFAIMDLSDSRSHRFIPSRGLRWVVASP